MNKRLIVFGLIVATLLSLIGNLVANHIEPLFAGQPYVLFGVFVVLLVGTIWYALQERREKEQSAKTEEGDGDEAPGSSAHHLSHPEADGQEIVPNYRLAGSDVVVSYKLAFPTLGSGRSALPPRIVGKSGRLFGRAGVFGLAVDGLLSEHPAPVVLYGFAGVGKSAIAAALAWGLAPHYAGGVLWLDGEMNDLSALCEEIGRLYADDTVSHLDLVKKIKRIRHLLNQQSTLVVLDGCEDRDIVQVFAEQCAPQGLVVTARQKMALVGRLVEVPPLAHDSARELFEETIQSRTTTADNTIDRVVSLLGGHPQATIIAGALCVEEHLSSKELYELIRQADQRIQRLQLGEESKNSVWASFEASYTRLTEQEQRIFRAIGGAWGKTITAALIGCVVKLSRAASADETLRQLAKHGLLHDERSSLGIRVYRIHDLIYSYAQGILREQGPGVDRMRREWLPGVVEYVQCHCQPDSCDYDALEVEMANILGASKWADQHQQWSHSNDLALSLWSCGIMELRGYATQGIKLLKRGRIAARQLDKVDDENHHLTSLAAAHFLVGDYRLAQEYATQALSVARVTGDSVMEEQSLEYLGRFERSAGNFEKSQELHRQALAIASQSGDRERENACLGFLAVDHYELGDFRMSIQLYEQALEVARGIADRVNEGRHLSRLADCYVALDEYETAIELYHLALEIARDVGNRIGEQFDLGGLGRAYFGLARYRLAAQCCERALEIARSVKYPEGQALRLAELSRVSVKVGQAAEGLELARESLGIAKKMVHAHAECGARLALAECAYTLENTDLATDQAQRALELATAIKNRDMRAQALHLLGSWALDRGDYEEANQHLSRELVHRQEMGQRQKETRAEALLAQCPSQTPLAVGQ